MREDVYSGTDPESSITEYTFVYEGESLDLPPCPFGVRLAQQLTHYAGGLDASYGQPRAYLAVGRQRFFEKRGT